MWVTRPPLAHISVLFQPIPHYPLFIFARCLLTSMSTLGGWGGKRVPIFILAFYNHH